MNATQSKTAPAFQAPRQVDRMSAQLLDSQADSKTASPPPTVTRPGWKSTRSTS